MYHQNKGTKAEWPAKYEVMCKGILQITNILDEFTSNGINTSPCGMIPDSRNLRWIIPLANKNLIISSLAMYQPSILKAKLSKQLIIYLTKFGLSDLVIKDKIYLRRNDDEIKKILQREDLHYAIFTGTEGCHRKVTIQVMDGNGIILAYIKVSDSEDINKLLKNEAESLEYLSQFSIKNGLYPKVLYHGKIGDVNALILNTIKNSNSKFSSKLSNDHVVFLIEIFLKTSKVIRFKESKFSVGLQGRMEALDSYLPDVWKQKYGKVFGYLRKNIGEETLPLGLCHRDFTPWNTFFHNDKIYVFDWEYAQREYSPLIDILHFIVQDGIFVRKLKPAELLKRISKNQVLIDKYLSAVSVNKNLMNSLLLCYLLDISLLYRERESGNVEGETLNKIETWGGMMDLVIEGT